MISRVEMRGLALVACVLAGCGSSNGDGSSNAANPAGSNLADAGMEAGADDGMTAPVAIAAPTPQSIYQTEPTVAIAPNGTVGVAWLDAEPGMATVGFAFSQDRGDTWGASQLLTLPNGAFASNEILVADSQNNFYLVTLAVASDQSSTQVLVGKAAAGASTFGPLVEASDPSSKLARDASAMSIAQDQSLVVDYVEYADATYQKSIVVSSRSTDRGATWTRTPLNAQGSFAWTNGCASRTSGKVAAVFLDAPKHATSVRWSDDDGATWPEANESDIATGESPGEFPSCAADGSDLWVMQGVTHGQASANVEPTLDRINLSHSADGGHTFDPAIAVQDTAAGSKYMRALATVQGDGSLSLVYYAGSANDDKAATVRRATSADRGKTFAPSEELYSPITLETSRTGNDWLGDLLGATSDSQNTFVAFVDNASGTSHVRFTRLTP